jgi:FixJ family two-component response regulator
LTKAGDKTPLVLISAFADDRARARAEQAGITCFLKKPFNGSALLECVEVALAA